jgi:hypothetical protein
MNVQPLGEGAAVVEVPAQLVEPPAVALLGVAGDAVDRGQRLLLGALISEGQPHYRLELQLRRCRLGPKPRQQRLPAGRGDLVDRASAAAVVGRLAPDAGQPLGDQPLWHEVQQPVSTLCAILAGEAYIHGWDIAGALRRPWRLDPEDMRTIFLGLLPVLPHYVDPRRAAHCTAIFDVRLRGDPAARAILAFDHGRLAIQPPDGQRVDCRISADPAAHLLVTYGRCGPLLPALRGRITAAGRKPWLGLWLPRLFRKP